MTYTPTNWNEGVAPGISAAQLDRMEAGIDFGHPLIVSDSAIDNNLSAISPSTRTQLLVVTLAIPVKWNTWDCFVWASYVFQNGSSFDASFLNMELDVDGTNVLDSDISQPTTMNSFRTPGSMVARVEGLSVTGDVDVELFATETAGNMGIDQKSLIAQGVRTS